MNMIRNVKLQLPDGTVFSIDKPGEWMPAANLKTFPTAAKSSLENYDPRAVENLAQELVDFSKNSLGIFLSTEGVNIGEKLKDFGKKILEKIQQIIDAITAFFNNIIERLGKGWHKHVVENAQKFKSAIKTKIDKIKQNFNEQKGLIYQLVLKASIVASWFKGVGRNILGIINKVFTISQKVPNTPEEAQQAQSEVTQCTEQVVKIIGEGEQKTETAPVPTSANVAAAILEKTLDLTQVQEQSITEYKGLLGMLQKGLTGFKTKLAGAFQSDKDFLAPFYSAVTGFFGTVIGKLQKLPLIKGTLHRDKLIKELEGGGNEGETPAAAGGAQPALQPA
jgi:regulator of sigma D